MSMSLVDIDANSRQPGFKPSKQGSMIPGAPKFQQSGSTGRRSPFSVSMTGSPSYTAMPTATKTVMSPTPASKLPRKSTPTQSAFSKSYTYGSRSTMLRTSLPRAREGLKPSATAVPANSNYAKTSPPLSCNKPLPSPPIAQFVNPASPPKAQRTLVDAEAGTPTSKDWPILQPEDLFPTKAATNPKNDGRPQRSVSEGSALRRNGIPVLKSRDTAPLCVNNGTTFQKSTPLIENGESSLEKFGQMTEPRALSSMNPYANSFHAFSTNTEIVIDSPLAHKQRTSPIVLIPPRASSKRSSLPLPDTAQDGLPAQPSSVSLRRIKPDRTKWPVLEATADLFSKHQMTHEDSNSHQQRLTVEPDDIEPTLLDGKFIPQSHYGSTDSVSTWNLAAGSSLDDGPEVDYEGAVRVKHLSWHSSNPDAGPILRISADADAVLLGRDDSIPAVPFLPENPVESTTQQHFFRTSIERDSKQILINMTPSTGSRTPTPTLPEAPATESKPVKITPIRSMQPPRKPSTGDLSERSALTGTPAPAGMTQDKGELESLQAHLRESLGTPQDKSSSQASVDAAPQASSGSREHSCEAGNYSITLHDEIPQKAMQVLDTNSQTAESVTRKRLPMIWMTPNSATFVIKKSRTPRSKTGPLLPSTERWNNRVSTLLTHSPSSASSGLSQSTPSQAGVRRPSPPRLGATDSGAQDLESFDSNELSSENQRIEQTAADLTLRIEAKRSFRNIFHRRDPKATPQPVRKPDSKRSSVVGSALAQRIKNSTNFSKISLARPSETNSEVKQDVVITSGSAETSGKETDRQAALTAIESDAADAPLQIAPTAHYDTATVIHKILDRVTSMGVDSPDRLYGLEVAEAVLHAVECSKEAQLSAELARKHAHDAELNAKLAGIELKRLEKLCEPGFDNKTMQALKLLITAAGAVRNSETGGK